MQVTRNLTDVVWWQFRALNHTNVCNDFATWCGKIFSGSITLEFCKFTNFKALLPPLSIDILSVILIKLSLKKTVERSIGSSVSTLVNISSFCGAYRTCKFLHSFFPILLSAVQHPYSTPEYPSPLLA